MRYKTGEDICVGDYLTIDYGHMHLQIIILIDSDTKTTFYGTDGWGAFAYFEEMKMEMFFPACMLEGEEANFIRRGIAPRSELWKDDRFNKM